MAYSLQTRKEVIDLVHQGTKISNVIRKYGISRGAIKSWLKSPGKYLSEARAAHTPFDIDEKVRILRLIESGELSARQIAERENLSLHTILGWTKDKDRIFAVYSSQGQRPVSTGVTISPGEEVPAVSTPDDKDTKQHIRGLKEENEYLKARVAYLEALMELNGTPVSGFKKKRNTRPSTEFSETGSER